MSARRKKVTYAFAVILAAAAAQALPSLAELKSLTVDDNEVWAQPGRSDRPLSPITQGERDAVLGQKYNQQACDQMQQQHKVEALESFARAEKLLGSSFMCRLVRGKLYGDLNRWSSALADFRKVLNSSHSPEDDSEILNYLLVHKQNEAALELSKSLDYGAPGSPALLLKSKILQVNRKLDRAIECAKMAYYLDSINGADPKKSVERLEALGQKPDRNERPNNSAASALWSALDPIIARGYEVAPGELKGLMGSSPSKLTGWDTSPNGKIPENFESESIDAPIRTIRGSGLNSEQPPTIGIEPNLFRCCLTEADLIKHFGQLQPGQFGGLPEAAPELEPKRLQVTKPWGAIMFMLSPGGAHYLQDMAIVWFKRSVPSVKTPTVSKPLADSLVVARRELQRRNFVAVKKAIFDVISELQFAAKYHSAESRAKYEQVKKVLEQVYLSEHKPAVAAYCKNTSFIDLYEVSESIAWDCKRDLPEFSPFTHEKWKIGHHEPSGTFFVTTRIGNFGSPADNALSKYLKGVIPAEKMVYGRQVEIDRPSSALVDAGVFGDK